MKTKREKEFTKFMFDYLQDALESDENYQDQYKITYDGTKEKKTVPALISLSEYKEVEGKQEKFFERHNFHPDILIYEERDGCIIPRVMIESKYKGSSCTTHEIMAYNQKAYLHKNLYPGLRYGLILGSEKGNCEIPGFVLDFGNQFDFIFAFTNELEENCSQYEKFINCVKRNIQEAKILEEVLQDKRRKGKAKWCMSVEKKFDFSFSSKEQ